MPQPTGRPFMDWKLFFSTFALIFLAELGDKTQLAVLATSAGNKSWLAVLLGAVFALAASTVIAVVVGLLLNKTLPEKWIQAAAAALFIIFGLVLARSAWQKFTVVERPAEVEAA
ncbi:MAG: TMEM165/GDT1 family protein, partial [Planctomycetota bacterium]